MKNILSLLAYAVMGVFMAALPVWAHSIGASLEQKLDDNIIDIGYDTDPIVAGQPVRFDFTLWNKDKTEPIDFTTAWVRITKKDADIVFLGYLGIPAFGPSNMSYAFTDSGAYELTVRFENKDKVLAETTFPLTIAKQSGIGIYQNLLISGFIGFLLGGTLLFLLKKK